MKDESSMRRFAVYPDLFPLEKTDARTLHRRAWEYEAARQALSAVQSLCKDEKASQHLSLVAESFAQIAEYLIARANECPLDKPCE